MTETTNLCLARQSTDTKTKPLFYGLLRESLDILTLFDPKNNRSSVVNLLLCRICRAQYFLFSCMLFNQCFGHTSADNSHLIIIFFDVRHQIHAAIPKYLFINNSIS